MKHKDYLINVGKNPTFIVGQNPGNRRRSSDPDLEGVCWNGNRSADFIHECIEGIDNIVLTNICQYKDMNDETMYEGCIDMQQKLDKLKPSSIICLGNISYEEMQTMHTDAKIYKIDHPSYALRFQQDKVKYKEGLRSLLCS